MKPILININEISDSREVYEAKPNIILSIFIYSVLGLLLVALAWMYFGRIDVVVKSEGMLRPNDQVATVVNTYAGTLDQVNVKDGSTVKVGETLYIVNHEELLDELTYYEEQLRDVVQQLELQNTYKRSIEDDVNYFTDSQEEEEYFIKYQSFENNYNLMKHGVAYSGKERKLSLVSITDQLDILYAKRNNINKLKKAVSEGKNSFFELGTEKEYFNLYLKYQSDYASLITQYANKRTEIDHSTTEEGLVNSLDYYNEVREGLKRLKLSIEKEKSIFDDTNSYSLQYEEYVNKTADLKATYEQAEETYQINKELEGFAVTEWEVQQSKAAMENSKRAIRTYEANYMADIKAKLTEVENKLVELKLSKENTITKDKLYEQNEKEKTAVLDNYKLKYLVELEASVDSLNENIASLEANKKGLELQGEKTLMHEETGIEVNLFKYRNDELNATVTSINTYQDKQKELQAGIDKINMQIEDAIVKATKSGVINANIDLVEGDVLSSGIQVLTIVPEDNNEYKVNIYVSNENIGKIKVGMKVKFNIYALPNSEYGYLLGTITNISKDLKVNQEKGTGYYLVEASLEHKAIYDAKGNKAQLKAGMTCQAQMITESKRILEFVLEKIDLWVHE